MDSLLESAFSLSPHSGVGLLPGGTVSDLEYADDVVLLSEDPGSLQDSLCSLGKSAAMFGMRFAPPKCKMMLQDWVGATPNMSIKGQFIEHVDKFTYLGSYINPDGSIAEELPSRIQKARVAFSNLHHLWRRNDIKLSTKGRVYSAGPRTCPSLSSCIIVDFGGWDMYCACRTTVFPGEPCSPNPKVAGKGPRVVST